MQTARKGSSRNRLEKGTLLNHFVHIHQKAETLSEEQNVYCVKVVMAFIKSEISLSKLECPDLRNLSEENRHRHTDCRHMLNMEPFFYQKTVHVYEPNYKASAFPWYLTALLGLAKCLQLLYNSLMHGVCNSGSFTLSSCIKLLLMKSWPRKCSVHCQ